MGIGDIIGGAVGRYGERSWEAAERQRKLEDIGRHANFNALLGHLTMNYENMLPEEHEAVIGKLETIYPGTTKGMLGPLVGGVRSISQIMPAVQSAPTSTPRTSIDQLPTTAETVPSPIAYSPVPAHTIRTPAQTPADILQQRKTSQAEADRQRKVSEIMASSMSEEDKALAIRALHIPAGVIAAQERQVSGAPPIGLSVIELVSPDGKKIINAQSTRTGQLIETGTGQVIDPARIQGWTKRHPYSPWIGIGQDSSPVVVNREEIARSGLGSVAGVVPDVKVAETKTPLVDLNTGNIAGQWGSRSGLGGMQGTGTTQEAAVELGRSPRPKTEIDARTYMDTALSQLEQIQEIAERRPDLVGQWDYTLEYGKRKLGLQTDPDANNLYNALDRFKEDLIRAKEGAVIPDAMYNRLANIVSGRAWTNEAQFKSDIANAAEVLRIARGRRGMPNPPTVQGRSKGGGTSKTNTPAGGIKLRRKSDGKTSTVPGEAWNSLTPEQQALYERQ